MKTAQMILLSTLCAVVLPAFCASAPSGKIVWWGVDFEHRLPYPGPTNGAIELAGEMLTNVVAIAAQDRAALALTSDGTLFTFGDDVRGARELAVGLSNVVSITVAGSSCWAINSDGTVTKWGADLAAD